MAPPDQPANTTSSTPPVNYTATIGPPTDVWSFSSTSGFDLTRSTSTSSTGPPITIPTTTLPITLLSSLTALLIIDMQNYFLSPAFSRPPNGPGHAALAQLTAHAIPAAREAGIRIVWVNWGLSDDDLATMPAGVKRAFGFAGKAVGGDDAEVVALDKVGVRREADGRGKGGSRATGLGEECGVLEWVEEDGERREVEGGRLLVQGSWNAGLYPPLDGMYEERRRRVDDGSGRREDVWVHKNRMSGLWGEGGELEGLLRREGIRTCLFAGVNTDQCVAGTLSDAFSKGYDCVLLRDGCGTTSPECARKGIEFNAAKTWGFVTTCKELAEGVAALKGGKL